MRNFTAICLVAGVMILTACAENPTQRTALLLADEIDAYEQAVGTKIQAEQNYYMKVENDHAAAANWTANLEDKEQAIQARQALTDQAIKDKNLPVSTLQNFLRDYNEAKRVSAEKRAMRAAELQKAWSVTFSGLTFRQQELRTARSGVMELAREETITDRAKELISIAKDVKDQLDKAKRAETGGQ